MEKLLESISKEMSEMTPEELGEPSNESQEGEEVVGKVNDEKLQKIYCLAQKIGKAANSAYAAGDTKKAYELEGKAKLLVKIFWFSVKSELDLWDTPQLTLGVRKGWEVVQYEEAPSFSSSMVIVTVGGPLGNPLGFLDPENFFGGCGGCGGDCSKHKG